MANEITIRTYADGSGTAYASVVCNRGATGVSVTGGSSLAAGDHAIEVTCQDTAAGYAESARVSAGTTRLSASGISDNFDRADGAIGANWAYYSGNGPAVISGNKAVATQFSEMHWAGSGAPGADQYVQGRILPSAAAQPYLVARFFGDGSGAQVKAADNGDSTYTLIVESHLDYTGGILGTYSGAFTAGVPVWTKLSIVGLVVTLSTSADGSAWTQRGQWTASALNVPASGPPGFIVDFNVTQGGYVDDWSAGDGP